MIYNQGSWFIEDQWLPASKVVSFNSTLPHNLIEVSFIQLTKQTFVRVGSFSFIEKQALLKSIQKHHDLWHLQFIFILKPPVFVFRRIIWHLMFFFFYVVVHFSSWTEHWITIFLSIVCSRPVQTSCEVCWFFSACEWSWCSPRVFRLTHLSDCLDLGWVK